MSLARSHASKALLALMLTLSACGGHRAGGDMVKLQGAGASFPAPIYTLWIKSFRKSHADIQVDYQSVGSGSGVKSVIDRTVDFGASDAGLARPPSPGQRRLDRAFRVLCRAFGWSSALLVAFIVIQIGAQALPAIREHGLGFLTNTTWDPSQERFAILPEIWGTVYSSCLALGIGAAFGLSTAVFLSEGFCGMAVFRLLSVFDLQHRPYWSRLPDQADNTLRNLVELLAAIPSVVYGLWGLYVVIPTLRPAAEWLRERLGGTALFGTPFRGPGVLMYAALVLLGITMVVNVIGAALLSRAGVTPARGA